MVCFSSCIDDPVIWTHYADLHRGMAFEFSHPRGADLLEIDYLCRDERPEISTSTYDNTWERDTRRALSTKWLSWKHEQEYRLILDLEDCSMRNGLYFTDRPFQHLTRVILGNQCGMHDGTCFGIDERYIERALKKQGLPHVKVARATLSPRGFRLVVK